MTSPTAVASPRTSSTISRSPSPFSTGASLQGEQGDRRYPEALVDQNYREAYRLPVDAIRANYLRLIADNLVIRTVYRIWLQVAQACEDRLCQKGFLAQIFSVPRCRCSSDARFVESNTSSLSSLPGQPSLRMIRFDDILVQAAALQSLMGFFRINLGWSPSTMNLQGSKLAMRSL